MSRVIIGNHGVGKLLCQFSAPIVIAGNKSASSVVSLPEPLTELSSGVAASKPSKTATIEKERTYLYQYSFRSECMTMY